MKYKIGLVIISILIIILTIFYVDYRKSNKEITNNKERTKIEYIFGNLSYNQALTIGEDKFLKTIKLIGNDYFDYKKDIDDNYKRYFINNEYFVEVINYGSIKEFLSKESIDEYNNLVGYLYFENKDYVKKYIRNINEDYVGSILNITNYTNEEIYYQAKNYYCTDYHFIGILTSEPDCKIKNVTESSFTIIKEGNILKIKDLNNFIVEKIY